MDLNSLLDLSEALNRFLHGERIDIQNYSPDAIERFYDVTKYRSKKEVEKILHDINSQIVERNRIENPPTENAKKIYMDMFGVRVNFK